MKRLAVFSDIHGNLKALEAVLDDLSHQSEPDAYWILGDLVAFCPWPLETLECLTTLPNASFVQGNTDRYLVTGRRPAQPVPSKKAWENMSQLLTQREANFNWTVARLNYAWYEFLRDLPTELNLDLPGYGRVMAVHAAPGDDEFSLPPDLPVEQIRPLVAGLDLRLWLYGHTHQPVDRVVDGVRLINPGGVGFSLDGDPRPSYATIDWVDGQAQVTHHRVRYDVESVIAELERVGHPARDWTSRMLRRARPGD